MPNQIILSMNQRYPFGGCQQPEMLNREVLVRKQINTGNKQELMIKAKNLKKLKVPHSIEIVSIFQGSNQLQIYYEYVPVKFQIWMKSMSDELSNNLQKQLYALATFLAQHQIQAVFDIQNLGFNQQYHIKYFLNFQSTYFDQQITSFSLKQKYYREISILLRSFNLSNDRNQCNPLFFSLRTEPQKNRGSAIKTLFKTLKRAPSLKLLCSQRKKEITLTQGSECQETEFQHKSKQSALKMVSSMNFNDKLKNLKEKLQVMKQSQLNLAKSKVSVLQFQKSKSKKESLIKKTCIFKKSVKLQKNTRGVSIDNIPNNSQRVNQIAKNRYRNTFEGENNRSVEKLSFFESQNKKNKSQKFRTPKTSQSPIEYLDCIKSNQQYVNDFLNVLQDSFESQDDEAPRFGIYQSQQTFQSQSSKQIQKTQQSQSENIIQEEKWMTRYSTAIEKSKKLIDKMRNPHKNSQTIIKI